MKNHLVHTPLASITQPKPLEMNSNFKRFRVLLESNLPNLQNEKSMIEINDRTTVKQLKQLIIAKNDEGSVTRTFIEQIKLSYEGNIIPTSFQEEEASVYELLGLNQELLEQNNSVIKLKLTKHEHVNGTGGLLSREFWKDFQSNDRFRFLPATNDSLQQPNLALSNSVPLESTSDLSAARSTTNPTATSSSSEQGIDSDISTSPTSANPVPSPSNYETLVPSQQDSIPFVNNPSESSTPNIDPIKPASIQVRGGSTWEMEGTSYDTMVEQHSGKKILVKQDDLSNVEYELTLKVDNIVKKVSLGTAQCIVVDNGLHDPYLLLGPMGAAKVHKVFKLASGEPLIQKVLVMMYDIGSDLESESNEQAVPGDANNIDVEDAEIDDLMDRLYTNGRLLLITMVKLTFVLYLMGFRLNQHMMNYWFHYAVLLVLLFHAYVLLCTGANRVIRFGGNVNDVSIMMDRVVRTCVRRTSELELVQSRDPAWLKTVKLNFENIWKDSLLFGLCIFPSMQARVFHQLSLAEEDVSIYEELVEPNEVVDLVEI